MTAIADFEITDDCTVELHPLLIRETEGSHFQIVRWGGRSRIATRSLGIEVLQMLRNGATLGQVRAALQKRFPSQSTNNAVIPLLRALYKANLIYKLGGRRISSRQREVTPRSVAYFLMRFYGAPALRTAAARLPLKLRERILFQTISIENRKALAPKIANATKNFKAVLPQKSDREVRDFGSAYYNHLIQNIVDHEILMGLDPGEVDRWLADKVECRGLEHLEAAAHWNKGVILCGFHFTGTSFIPACLIRHGYSLTTMGTMSLAWGLQQTKQKAVELHHQYRGYGSLDIIDNYGLQNVRKIIGLLRQGHIVMCLPDVYSIPAAKDQATQARSRFFDLTRSPFHSSQVKIRLFGAEVYMNEWAGWLAVRTGAALLPAAVFREKNKKLILTIAPSITCVHSMLMPGQSAAAASDLMNRELFEVLERYLTERPEQWFGWHNLHQLGLTPSGKLPEGMPEKQIQ